jgi:hypothetical protein
MGRNAAEFMTGAGVDHLVRPGGPDQETHPDREGCALASVLILSGQTKCGVNGVARLGLELGQEAETSEISGGGIVLQTQYKANAAEWLLAVQLELHAAEVGFEGVKLGVD